MNAEVRRWYAGEGERLLRKVGLRPGDIVLDFGCGGGCYTIPAAGVVGAGGTVYALDRNTRLLNDLMEEASYRGLRNIIPVRDLGALNRILEGRLLNGVLLYDVIHGWYFTSQERKRLLSSVAALVAGGGLVSIFPSHMSPTEIGGVIHRLEGLDLVLETELEAALLHDERFSSGRIYNFRARS